MFVSYRAEGHVSGTISLFECDLNIAFNRVAHKLIAEDGFPADYTKSVRYEGRVKINGRNYPAISQAGLIVVEKGPALPDRIELKF
jgi:hypothetical protein